MKTLAKMNPEEYKAYMQGYKDEEGGRGSYYSGPATLYYLEGRKEARKRKEANSTDNS